MTAQAAISRIEATNIRPIVPISAQVRRTIDSMIRTQGIGDLYRMLWQAESDGLDFHLASIPEDFDGASDDFFDPAYMRLLFDLGSELARTGEAWRTPGGDVAE